MDMLTDHDAARFWLKVDKNGPVPEHVPELGPCWIWTGSLKSRRKDGAFRYGRFSIGRDWHAAHRVAWELKTGNRPEDIYICHECDNTVCVNPAHIFAGNALMNYRDMVTKGRDASGDRHYSRSRPESLAHKNFNSSRRRPGDCQRHGIHNGAAKLTERCVADMRWWASVGVADAALLATHFQVKTRTVRNILAGETWPTVQASPMPAGTISMSAL